MSMSVIFMSYVLVPTALAPMAIHGCPRRPVRVPQLVLRFEAIGLKGHGTPFGVVVDIDQEGLDRNNPLVNVSKKRWKDPPFLIGKPSINGHF